MKRRLFWVTFFSIAMGFLEAAVVIYLRKLYYPHGFSFPLTPMPNDVSVVEIWREAGTIIMLLSVGILAGTTRAERFSWFIFSFAVWDILYYVFLYLFISWPQSLLTWDILFLIPVPWVGPVITPIIISLTMILFALTVIYHSGNGRKVTIRSREAWLLAVGALIAIIAFTKDYMHQNGDVLYTNIRKGGALFTDLINYVPAHFDWVTFSIGEGLILVAYFLHLARIRHHHTNA